MHNTNAIVGRSMFVHNHVVDMKLCPICTIMHMCCCDLFCGVRGNVCLNAANSYFNCTNEHQLHHLATKHVLSVFVLFLFFLIITSQGKVFMRKCGIRRLPIFSEDQRELVTLPVSFFTCSSAWSRLLA